MFNRPEGYVGKLEIAWADGEKNVFEVSQKDGFIWIGDHVVSPRNEKSMKGVLEEVSTVFSEPPRKINQYRWVELVGQLRFPKI
jgi:hypothetical protein